MRKCCGRSGVGALIAAFLVGLVLAMCVPSAAIVLLAVVILLAALLLINQLRR